MVKSCPLDVKAAGKGTNFIRRCPLHQPGMPAKTPLLFHKLSALMNVRQHLSSINLHKGLFYVLSDCHCEYKLFLNKLMRRVKYLVSISGSGFIPIDILFNTDSDQFQGFTFMICSSHVYDWYNQKFFTLTRVRYTVNSGINQDRYNRIHSNIMSFIKLILYRNSRMHQIMILWWRKQQSDKNE